MAPFFSRRLRCFYCGGYSNNAQSGTPRSWLCGHCEAVNHLDEHGEISEPPAHSTTTIPRVRFAASRATSPMNIMPNESPFCNECQRNLTLIDRMMAEYIPEEDDPEYENHVATANTYRAELDTRFPYPCEKCIHAVNQQLRNSDYLAKSDALRRVLQNSKENRMRYSAPRQLWTLRIVRTAKPIYILSIVTGILWHVLAISASSMGNSEYKMYWDICLKQLWRFGEVDSACFNSTTMLKVVGWALSADLATIWWNPKLEEKTVRAGGRMRGLTLLWIVRAIIFGFRTVGFLFFRNVPEDQNELQFFRNTHIGMATALVGSVTLSWYLVSTEYQSTKVMRPIGPHLPQAQSVAVDNEAPAPYKPVRPKVTTYDTMSQSFTSSLANPNQTPPSNFPPSPTLSASSISTRPTEASTPFPRKFSTATLDDEMDWTPTRPRFGSNVDIHPPAWPKPEPIQSSPPKHSLFGQKDPNPFANKVPTFPKNPNQKIDPWKQGVWAPALPAIKRNFFTDMMSKGASPDSQKRITEGGVPKKVKEDAELFQAPQLKYDYQGYSGYKTTGLEDKFNDLFS